MGLEDDFREGLYRAVADAKQEGEHGKPESELPLERRYELSVARVAAMERMLMDLASEVDRLKRPG